MTDYVSQEDFNSILRAMGESTTAISNLAIKLEHQSEIIEADAQRNDKRIDKLELKAEEERKTSAQSRKEMHKQIHSISERLVPTELVADTIKTISTKLISTLVILFVTGGFGMFMVLKAMEQQ
jgi:Fe2+ transport system protein B